MTSGSLASSTRRPEDGAFLVHVWWKAGGVAWVTADEIEEVLTDE